jgi:hypothetical protein
MDVIVNNHLIKEFYDINKKDNYILLKIKKDKKKFFIKIDIGEKIILQMSNILLLKPFSHKLYDNYIYKTFDNIDSLILYLINIITNNKL